MFRGLQLRDIKLSRDGKTLIAIDEIALAYSIRELTQPGTVIRQIRLTRPRITAGKLPDGSVNGTNITGQPGYMGPGAPPGPRYHHYVFELYALNAKLDLPATATREQLIAAMQGKTVAKAAYVGRFKGTAPPQ